MGWAGGVFYGMLFRLLHCAAWDFHFPTPVERLLLRIAVVETSLLSLIYGLRGMGLFVIERIQHAKGKKGGVRKSVLSSGNPIMALIGVALVSLYICQGSIFLWGPSDHCSSFCQRLIRPRTESLHMISHLYIGTAGR